MRGSGPVCGGDIYTLPYESDFFDAIIGVGLIDTLSDPDRAFREMYRVMSPGGILIVTVPNIMSPFMAYETAVPKVKGVVKSALAAVGLRNPERAYFQRHYVPWQLDRELKRAGFHKADFSFCTYGFSNSERMESFSLGLSRKFDRFSDRRSDFSARITSSRWKSRGLTSPLGMKQTLLRVMRASGVFATFRRANQRKVLILSPSLRRTSGKRRHRRPDVRRPTRVSERSLHDRSTIGGGAASARW